MKKHRRSFWTTEVHTYKSPITKEKALVEFIHKLEISIKYLEKVQDTLHVEMLKEVIENIKKKYPKLVITPNPFHPTLEKDSEERYRFAASSWYRMGQLDLESATGLRIKNFSEKLELTTV